jgi:sugar-phosphatase
VTRAGSAALGPALLFDVDGVLIDSTAVYELVWREWAALRGLDGDTVVAATWGRRGADTIAEVLPSADYAAEAVVLADLLTRRMQHIPAMPGAVGLLAGLPPQSWACVTSGSRAWVGTRLTEAGLPVPPALVTADDVTFGKPHPDCYLLGARLLERAPEDCIVIEDSPAGVAAGKAAGMTVVGLLTTHQPADVARADYVFGDLLAASDFLLQRVRSGR